MRWLLCWLPNYLLSRQRLLRRHQARVRRLTRIIELFEAERIEHAESHRACLDRLAAKHQEIVAALEAERDCLKRQLGLCIDFMDHYSRLYRRMTAENETVIESLMRQHE